MASYFVHMSASDRLVDNTPYPALAAIIVAACIWKALRHGINNDGWSETGGSDHSDAGPSCD